MLIRGHPLGAVLAQSKTPEQRKVEALRQSPCELTSLTRGSHSLFRAPNNQGPPGTKDCPIFEPSGTPPWLLVGALPARLVAWPVVTPRES